MTISNDDLKEIIDSLYKPNFYEVISKLEKLTSKLGGDEGIYILYYFVYDFMEWLTNHKKDINIQQIIDNKNKYFNKINEKYNLNKSDTYLKLYIFLEKNFNRFSESICFDKKSKSINLINQALKENPNNLEAQFYNLFINNKIDKCFKFLNKNTMDSALVSFFINSMILEEKYKQKILILNKNTM